MQLLTIDCEVIWSAISVACRAQALENPMNAFLSNIVAKRNKITSDTLIAQPTLPNAL